MPNEFVARNGIIALNNSIVTGSLTVTAGVTGSFSGSLSGTASYATNALSASYALNAGNAQSSSFAATASSADNFTVRNTLTAQTIVVQTITSSTDFVTGSSRFGSLITNTHQFTGSVSMTGSLTVIGPVSASSLTSSTDATINGHTLGRGAGNAIENTAFGNQALIRNTTGNRNTAMGWFALSASNGAAASSNTAVGALSMRNNLIGQYNSGFGEGTLFANTSGTFNTTIGYNSLAGLTDGTNNVGVGAYAGTYITGGAVDNTTSDNGVYIGYAAYASQSNTQNEIVIGANTTGNGSNTVTLGNTSITRTILRGNVSASSGFTGSLLGTASFATSASWAPTGVAAAGTSNFIATGSISASVDTNPAQSFRIVSGSSTFMHISSSGNVGFGVTASFARFKVAGPNQGPLASSVARLGFADSSSAAVFTNADPLYGILLGTLSSGVGWIQQQRIDGTATSYNLSLQPNGSNVGVGTPNPQYRLQISGTLGFASGSASSLFADRDSLYNRIFEPAGNVAIYLGNASDPGNYYDNTHHYFRSRGGGTTYATISGTNGNLGIGLGSTFASARLHISASSNNALRIESQDNSDTNPTVYIEGNKGGSAPYTATLIELRSNLDSRGRGIHMTISGSNTRWFAGVPYQGAGYQIGFDSSANGLPYTYQSSSLFIDTNRNIGIGTTAPTAKLHIASPNGSDGTLFQRWDYANSPGVYELQLKQTVTANVVRYNFSMINSSTAFNDVLVLDRGNVGVGTVNPSAKFVVSNAGTQSIEMGWSSVLNANYIESYNRGPSVGAEDLALYTAGNKSIRFYTNALERVIISGSGNVGIGVASPNQKLDVSGRLKFRSDGTNSAGHWLTANNGSEDVFVGLQGTTSTDAFGIYSGGSWRFTILNGGNVGIGTTSPTNALQIVGNTATDHSITDITNTYRIFKPRGGTYVTQTATVNGAIKLVYPVGFTNTMHTIKATVYEYATQQSFTVTLGGYNYSFDQSWYNVFAQIEGDAAIDRNFPVRFGFSGSNCVAYIGNLNSTWAYPQVFIEEVNLGYSGYAAGWTGSWAIDFETVAFRSASAAGLSTVANTNAHNFARNGADTYYTVGNVGIGTTNPTRKLSVSSTQAYMSLNASSYRTYSVGSDAYGFVIYDDTSAAYRLVISGSNGNVGIGSTLSPTNKLEVNNGGTVTYTGNDFVFRNANGQSAFYHEAVNVYWFSNLGITFYPGQAQSVTFTAAGKVGVGLTAPLYKLEVSSSALDNHIAALGPAPSLNLLISQSNSPFCGTIGLATATSHFLTGTVAGDLTIVNRGVTSGSIIFGFGSTERARITPVGNVGIGTTAPAEELHIYGDTNATIAARIENINAGASAFSTIQLGSAIGGSPNRWLNMGYSSVGVVAAGPYNPTGSFIINYGNGGLNFMTTGSNAGTSHIKFFTSGSQFGTERMRIEEGGNVSIGLGSATASAKFHVSGSIRTDQPTGGVSAAASYRWGSTVVASGLTLLTTRYIEVEIDGVVRKVGLVA